MADKKYDWFAALVQNPDLMLNDFKNLGVTPDNSEFKSRSDYEGLPQVQEAFKDNNGNFNKEAFNQYYDNALLLYNNYAQNEYVPKATELFGYLDTEWDRPQGSKVIDTTPRFSINNTAQIQSYGIDYINKSGNSLFGKQSAREIGQQQKVVDFETGETLDWTPDDKTGLVDALFRPTLVLASYDEDEYDEKGALLHKRGDLKYNSDGLPYYETLGNRSISGKQVLTYSDSLTRENSWLNKYDFFDSDGMDKSLIGTVAKTAFTTIPYLIPGVGEVLGGLTAIVALNRVLPVLGKAIASMAGQGDSDFVKQMNQYEGLFAKFDPSVSDNSQEHLVSWENLGNLISSVSGQLFQQRVVGSIPMLLNKSGDIVKQSQLGRNLAYGYMALTSAQDSYNTFKEAGASDIVSGWAFVANMIALGGLMATDYGKGLLFKGSWLDENVLKAPAREAAEQVRNELTRGIENATPKEKAKFINRLIGIYNKHFSSAAADTFVNRGVSEALEEVMEEGILDISKVLASTAEAIGINVGNKKLDFGLSWTDVMQRYGMAAAGGFVGGGIFHLQGKWDKLLANDMVQHTDEDTLQKLTYYIAQGRGQEIRDYYRQWHAKGLLGSTSLGTNLSTISSIDGDQVVSEAANGNLSQNDVVFSTLMNYINTIEDTISKEGLRIDTGSLVRNALIGYKESDRSLRADTLINLGVHDLLIKDTYDLATKIVEKTAELNTEINRLTVKQDSPDAKAQTEENIKNSQTIKNLQLELDQLRQQRDSILKGENNWKYIGQAIFASNTELAKNFIDLSVENYTRVFHGKRYASLSDDEKEAMKKEHAEYMKNTGKNQVLRAFDVYLGLSQRYSERLAQENKSLKGYQLNESSKVTTQFQESFIKKLKDLRDTATEYNTLVAKEEKTDEDNTKIIELKSKLEQLEQSIKDSSQSAASMFIHPSGDNEEIIKLLTKPILTPEENATAFALVGQMYQNYAVNKQQLNNDFEYITLVRNTVNEYLASGSVSDKIDAWIDGIEMRESNGGSDPGLWTSWLMDVGLYDSLYDEDEDRTAYDGEFLKDIKELANTFIDNLGTNNQIALSAYNQIKQRLLNAGFSNEDVNSFLATITPDYFENGVLRPITEFVERVDALRGQINYSSFNELLQDFATDILGERKNILDLINQEKLKLINSQTIDDYFIRNAGIKSELEEAKQLIKMLRAMLKGTIDKTNGSINTAKPPIQLAELDENTARILYRQSFDLENEINTLLGISDLNGARTLRIHEEIDRHMRGRYIWTLINDPTFVQKFGELFYTEDESGLKTPINIKTIADNLLQGRLDLSKADNADPAELMKFEVAFETALYDEVNKTGISKDPTKFAKALVSLFNDAWKMDTSKMSTNTDVISPYSLLSYLQLVVSVPAETFYNQYKTTTQADDSKFAPIYNQEMAIRHVSAEIARPDLSNAILNELVKQVDTSHIDPKDTLRINWAKNLSPLNNFVIVPGGAGCGKTTAVAQNVAKMYSGYDHEFLCLAPQQVQAENLAKTVGENVRHTNKAQFFKSIFGLDLNHYRFNEKTGHYELAEIPVIKDNLFDKSKKLKVLFIDEISLFTESELKLISKYAESHGIIVVGLGDPVQNSAKVYTDEILTEGGTTQKDKQKTWHSTGLEDCMYFGSSYLTASLRTSNLAKYENFVLLSNALDKVLSEWRQKRESTFDELDAFVPEKISLHYYEDDNIFYGEKIVDKNADLIPLAEKYSKLGQVTIITDDLNKYQSVPKNVTVKAYNDMQGMETDFVLVDVDFNKNNSFGGNVSKYSMLRDLYTLSQRSRVGTVIKNNGLNALNIEKQISEPEYGQRMIMESSDIETFKKRRGEILNQLPEGGNLYDFVYKFKIPTTSSPVVTQPTPVQSPQKPQGSPAQPTNNTPASNPSGNPSGSNPKDVPPMLPPDTKPESVKEPAKNLPRKGTTRMYNSYYSEFLFGSQFREVETTSPNSILNWKERNGWKDIQIPNNTYRKLVQYLASGIKTDLEVSIDGLLQQIVDANLGKDVLPIVSKLKSLFKTVPEIYISEYNQDNKIITAIYRNENDFIEIPIGFTQTALTGRYNGKFKRNQILQLGKDEQWRTVKQFQEEHPDFIISDDWGIITDQAEGFEGSTANYLSQNKGKVVITITDEPAYIPYLSNWHKRDGNWSVSHYKDISVKMLQKPVNPETILKFVTALHYKNADTTDINILMERGLWENPEDIVRYLTGNELSNLPIGSEYYRVINGRAYQVLPMDRAKLFMQAALMAASNTSDFSKFVTHMTMFMHFVSTPNKTLQGERHGMILTEGDKSIVVRTAVMDNKIAGYDVFSYDNGIIGERIGNRIPAERQFPFLKIAKQFGMSAPQIEFVRFILPVGATSSTLQQMSPNDNIFMLFGTDNYNLEQLSQRMLQNSNFVNGIYVNDPGGDLYDPTSAYRRFIGNKDGYMIQGNYFGTVWSIDEGAIIPINAQPNPLIETINQFNQTFNHITTLLPQEYQDIWNRKYNKSVDKLKSGMDVAQVMLDLVTEINKNMAFKHNDWNGYELSWSGSDYILTRKDNFDLWLQRRVKSLMRAKGLQIDDNTQVEVWNNQLKNWKYANILLTLPDGSHQYGVLNMGKTQYEYNTMSKPSYNAYLLLQQRIQELGNTLSPIIKYLHSIVFNYTTGNNVNPLQAAQWISNNSEILGDFSQLLNNYLEQRILNEEC